MSTRQSEQSSQDFFPPPPAVGLGIATDLESRLPCTRLIPVADGHVLTTPTRPDYYDGNMTFLRRPPKPADDWTWRAAEAIKQHGAPHVQIGWEQPLDHAPIALGEPFAVSSDVVMTRPALEDGVRDEAFFELAGSDDLRDLQELDTICAAEWKWPQDFTSWYSGQTQERVKRGVARWFAMKDAGQLVATAGLVVTSNGLRFQDVQTHPQARRQGWATRLISSMLSVNAHKTTPSGSAHMKTPSANAHQQTPSGSAPDDGVEFVLVAEEGSGAESLYKKLGFTAVSRQMTARVVNTAVEVPCKNRN